tara:strand:- start:7439 stop:8410 length:972 start_codon:yes stop_codon:yes gene_type:complete
MSKEKEFKELDEDNQNFALGQPMAGDRLVGLETWKVPRMTENDALILNNAFNHNFEPQEYIVDEEPVPPTLEEIEAIRREAYQEGFKEGQQEGFNKGLQEGTQAGQEQGREEGLKTGLEQGIAEGLVKADAFLSQFEQLMHQIKEPLHNINAETENQLLQLVSLLSKSVIMNELKAHPEHILSAIRLGIEALPANHHKIKLYLNPEDIELVERLYDAHEREERQWLLESDTSLTRGELRIETDYSHIDLTLEKRIQKVFEDLENLKDAPVGDYHAHEDEDITSEPDPEQVLPEALAESVDDEAAPQDVEQALATSDETEPSQE